MFSIARLTESDQPTLKQFWKEHWGADFMVVHGKVFKTDELDGFAALDGQEWLGVVTFCCEGLSCEILSLDSLRPGSGIGTALLKVAIQAARLAGSRTVRLTTTNDNTAALRFYQKFGFELAALHRQAVTESRRMKPSIPEIGIDGIPIRDEIELELHLPPPNPDLCT